MQEPLPELRQLRQQQGAWHIGTAAASSNGSINSRVGSAGVALLPRQPMCLGDGVAGFSTSVDLELQVAKGDADSFVLVMHPFEGVAGAAGAAIAYCWSTNTLQVRARLMTKPAASSILFCCFCCVPGDTAILHLISPA